MKRILHGRLVLGLALWLFGLAASAVAQDMVDNCVVCHGALDDDRLNGPVATFADDVHGERGLGCVACHGGDPTAPGFDGMDPNLGFLGKPSRATIPSLCGRCHSDADYMRQFNPSIRIDQVAEYATSVHGRRLNELSDTAVATCVSCHPAHQIRPPSDPASSVHPRNVANTCAACHADADRMAEYGIPTDQHELYQRSVHWEMLSEEGDLGAPTCNDCHGNHGAAPPGIAWVGNVCGQCHSVMADKFADSRHSETFTMLGVPGCATCHRNHDIVRADDTLLGLGEGAVCVRCHTSGDPGGEAAGAMRALLDSLGGQFDTAHALLMRAENAGMEVSNALFELEGVTTSLVSARAAVHSFDVNVVTAEVDEGLAIAVGVFASGERALRELRFRRTGLVVFVMIIVALIVGLVMKIRQTENRQIGVDG